MSLDKALSTLVSDVPECLAAGFVDLSTGMLFGIKAVDSHSSEVMDILAAAAADLFQGKKVKMIEDIFKKSRGTESDGHHYFQEIIINSDNLLHVFFRCKTSEEFVVCVVCRKSVNLGMALTKVRRASPEIEATV